MLWLTAVTLLSAASLARSSPDAQVPLLDTDECGLPIFTDPLQCDSKGVITPTPPEIFDLKCNFTLSTTLKDKTRRWGRMNIGEYVSTRFGAPSTVFSIEDNVINAYAAPRDRSTLDASTDVVKLWITAFILDKYKRHGPILVELDEEPPPSPLTQKLVYGCRRNKDNVFDTTPILQLYRPSAIGIYIPVVNQTKFVSDDDNGGALYLVDGWVPGYGIFNSLSCTEALLIKDPLTLDPNHELRPVALEVTMLGPEMAVAWDEL